MLFSATLSYRVLELTYEYMNLPEVISVTPEEVVVEGIDQALYHVGRDEKLELLLGLLQREEWERVLIFCNTKAGVDWLTRKLRGNGYPAEGITGDLPQPKRLALMGRFKAGKVKILVATDVASRGIHVEDISHVVNYDLPQDSENYIHRIGRTARAGKKGRALTLACERYVYHLEPLEEMLGYKLPVVWPEEDWFVEDRAGFVRGERKDGAGRTRPRKPKRDMRSRESGRRRPPRKPATTEPQAQPRPPAAPDAETGEAELREGSPAEETLAKGSKSRSRSRKRRSGKKARPAEPAGRDAGRREPPSREAEAEKEKPRKEPQKDRPTKEARPTGPPGKKIATSPEPGGVFGLAPPASDEVPPKKAKKGRRKRKKKPAQDSTDES
jgi:ATP-dependent RNA helicase RhlB